MIMSAIGCFAVIMFVNRNPAIIFVMMMCIDADLRRAMCRVVNRPRRNRNAHTKRKPDESEQTQEMVNGAIHHHFVGDAQKFSNRELRGVTDSYCDERMTAIRVMVSRFECPEC